MKIQEYKENISPNNINARILNLCKKRDKIGDHIDRLVAKGKNTEASEKEYEEVVSTLDILLKWRSECTENCLLEGEPGYSIK